MGPDPGPLFLPPGLGLLKRYREQWGVVQAEDTWEVVAFLSAPDRQPPILPRW